MVRMIGLMESPSGLLTTLTNWYVRKPSLGQKPVVIHYHAFPYNGQASTEF